MPDHAAGFQIVPPARHFRFGPFQVDSRSGELRKHGIKLKLGQQTFQLLLMLLEHPGEVILREEIRQKLWPHDTVVEFDHSINAAIQKLRAALGESAGSPLYIETLARRGYRFIGTMEIVPSAPANLFRRDGDRFNRLGNVRRHRLAGAGSVSSRSWLVWRY